MGGESCDREAEENDNIAREALPDCARCVDPWRCFQAPGLLKRIQL